LRQIKARRTVRGSLPGVREKPGDLSNALDFTQR